MKTTPNHKKTVRNRRTTRGLRAAGQIALATMRGGPAGGGAQLFNELVGEGLHRATRSRGARRGKSSAHGTMSQQSASLPVTQSYITRAGAPHLTRTDESVDVVHSEFLGDITHTAAFTVTTYPLNPGLVTVFRWLSTLSRDFQEYVMKSFRVRFVTRVNAITEGTIYMAFDYDSSDAPPPDEAAVTSYVGMMEFPPWTQGVSIAADMKNVAPHGSKYIRSGNRGGDIKLYDFAKLVICTSGADAGHNGQVAGKLFLDYDCHLMVPQVDIIPSFGSTVSTIYVNPMLAQVVPVGIYTNVAFTEIPVTAQGNAINPLRLTVNGAGFNLPTGPYLFTLKVALGFTATSLLNGGRISLFVNGAIQNGLYEADFGYSGSSAFSADVSGILQILLPTDLVDVRVFLINNTAAIVPARCVLILQAIG